MEEEQKPEQHIVLTITLLPDGRLTVSGPISQKMLSYGMLEAAKDVIREHHTSQVIKSNGHGILNFARKRQ